MELNPNESLSQPMLLSKSQLLILYAQCMQIFRTKLDNFYYVSLKLNFRSALPNSET